MSGASGSRPKHARKGSRPPRHGTIRKRVEQNVVSTRIWKGFAKDFCHPIDAGREEAVREICATAHSELETELIVRSVEPDTASYLRRVGNVATALNRLLHEMLAEKTELTAAGQSTVDVDGLAPGERDATISGMTTGTSLPDLSRRVTPELRHMLAQPLCTSQAHPVYGAADPVDVGALIKHAALALRRSEAELAAGGTLARTSRKSANRIFLETMGLYIDELCEAFLNEPGPRFSDDGSGNVSGWLPDLLTRAEAHAIVEGLAGMKNPMPDSVFRNLCNEISASASC